MIGQGADIDPVSGKPLSQIEGVRKQAASEREKKQLAKQAEFAQVSNSDAAEALRELLRKKLEQRIKEVLADDPEAAAYVAILKEMRDQTDMAQRAVTKLIQYGQL